MIIAVVHVNRFQGHRYLCVDDDAVEMFFMTSSLSGTSLILRSGKRSLVNCSKIYKQTCREISLESVVNEENKRRCISRFKKMPSIRLKPGEVPEKQAAVLVPICLSNGDISMLYTLRSSGMPTNAGQVSFPGGMKNESDKNLMETAVRETEEELGIAREVVDVWCTGNFIGTWDRKMGVMPVLGFLGDLDVNKLETNPREVEEAFVVPLRELCEPNNSRYTKYLRGYCMPVYISGKHKIWGLTAIITHLALSALLQDRYSKDPSSLFRIFSKVK